MAAGLVVRTISGLPVLVWADDTGTPTEMSPVHLLVSPGGVALADETGIKISTSQLAPYPESPQNRADGFTPIDVVQDGIIAAALDTAKIGNGTHGTLLTPKYAKIAASSSGHNEIVAAVTAKKIRVLQFRYRANGAVNAKWQSDGAGTPVDLTGLSYMSAAGDGDWGAFCPIGHFESASGKSLGLNLSTGVAVGGSIVYVEV